MCRHRIFSDYTNYRSIHNGLSLIRYDCCKFGQLIQPRHKLCLLNDSLSCSCAIAEINANLFSINHNHRLPVWMPIRICSLRFIMCGMARWVIRSMISRAKVHISAACLRPLRIGTPVIDKGNMRYTYLSIYLSIYLYIYVYLAIYLYVCLSICLSVYLFIYLCI